MNNVSGTVFRTILLARESLPWFGSRKGGRGEALDNYHYQFPNQYSHNPWYKKWGQVSPERLWTECEVRRLRRSKPGGRHRNKVDIAVGLHHLPSGVNTEANERRSQIENRSVAIFRLRINLALEVRRPCAAEYVPSVFWQLRCSRGLKVMRHAR